MLDYEPTCGAGVRLDREPGDTGWDDGVDAVVLWCVLHPDHHEDHEDARGNRWHLTYDREPGGPLVEGVALRWWHGG